MMLLTLIGLLFLIGLCCSAAAEEEPLFGMGRRHYLGEGRLDIKYTTELPTPHVDWADPFVNGPIKVFAIPSVMEGRTLVELMQRLAMNVDAVTIDPSWDTNKWTMSFGEAYGARSERNDDGSIDYSFVYKYLEEDLTSDRTWDVMIMHGILGWEHLPQTVREAILKRVKHGMGLVLVGPLGGESLKDISPLLPTEEPPSIPNPGRQQQPIGAWQAEDGHFITFGVPLETLPCQYLRPRPYTLGPGATGLASADGTPVIAVCEIGLGRVVALGYENYGLAPLIQWSAYGEVGDAWWETWYSLFVRATIWAAQKEAPAHVIGVVLGTSQLSLDRVQPVPVTVSLRGPLPEQAAITWQVRNDAGTAVLKGTAPVSADVCRFDLPVADLNGGRHFLDVFLLRGKVHMDWSTVPFEVPSPLTIDKVQAAPHVIEEGRPTRVTATLSAPLPEGVRLCLELVDNYQRAIAATDTASVLPNTNDYAATFTTDDLLTHIGWARVTLYQGTCLLSRKQVRVDFATPARLRVWDDYEVNVPFYGPHNYYHWMPLVDRQYRTAGVTWLMEPERNFRFSGFARPNGLGVYHYDRKPFEEQRQNYWRTGDKKYLERQPCFHRGWKETARAEMEAQMAPHLKYHPFHYYLYDEPSLTSYSRPFDLCYAPETIAAYREWLKTQYPSLKALNAEWDTKLTRWEQIEPPTTEEAQEQHRLPEWADFRRFMELTYADALRFAQQVVDENDPGAKTLVGGTQVPTPHNGTDWWLFSQTIGILEPYFGLDEFRSFNPNVPIIQACGYADAGPELEEELWRRFLRRQHGATIFWNYTFHDPDLALNSQGLAMQRAFGVLRGRGVAKLMLGGARDDSRIAVLYSQPSLRTAWIQDGNMREGWSGRSARAQQHSTSHQTWQMMLHAFGYQFHYLSYEQLAKSGVDRRRFDVLVLPDALALSDAEVTRIKAFLAVGGTVIADGEPGKFDEHSKARTQAALRAEDGVRLVELPHVEPHQTNVTEPMNRIRTLLSRAGVSPPAQVSQQVGQVVRFADKQTQYVALADAPAAAHTLTFDRKAHVYDVRAMRYLGETEKLDVPEGRARVAVYALLPAKVDAVRVTTGAEAARGSLVTFTVKAKSAVSFRHVYSVKVYDPAGAERFMYATNLDAPKGTAEGSFHLALNDPAGAWRLVATDAATGVRGEAVVQVK